MKIKKPYQRFVTGLLIFALTFIFMGATAMGASYKGDGAVQSTLGGVWIWTLPAVTSKTTCLECHGSGTNQYFTAPDKTSYLMTGHKNMLRPVKPGYPWAAPDGTAYGNNDGGSPYYGNDTYDWSAGTVTLGPPNTPATVPIYFIFGAWLDPTQLNTVYQGGFTGEMPGDSPPSDYFCARCHTTGYRFDNTGPQPAYPYGPNAGQLMTDTDFKRVPVDYITSDGSTCTDTTGTHCTSSWYENGIQCERCHRDVANEAGGHNCYIGGTYSATYTSYSACTGAGGSWTVVKPTYETATALCLECHREENVDTTANTITLTTDLAVSGNSCSDGTSPDSLTCVNGGGTWTAPFFDTEPGQTFLNSPHARFTGSLAQTTQNVPDLSVSLTGSYNSAFKNSTIGDPDYGKNKGCGGCHDVHQGIVEAVNAPKPIKAECSDCHRAGALSDPNAPQINLINHPSGAGTPLEKMATEPARPCIICHMESGAGNPPYHLMRINVDANYSTFPTAIQPQPQIGNTASDGKIAAVWSDIDLACGQCHGGSAGSSATQYSAPYMSKSALAGYAVNIHNTTTSPGFVHADFTWTQDTSVSKQVDFDASRSTCPSGTCTYSWSGAFTATGITVHNSTWTGSAPYTVTLTVTDTASNSTDTKTDPGVTPKTLYTNLTPALTTSVSGFTVTVTDATTNNNGTITGAVKWGDGSADGSITAVGGNTTHTYAKAGTYIIKYVVTDLAVDSAGVNIAKNTSARVVVGTSQGYSISGTVENNASAAILNANATLSLLDSTGKVLRRTSANADGTFTFRPVAPGTYTIGANATALVGTTPTRFTFANVPVTVQNNGSGSSGVIVKAN